MKVWIASREYAGIAEAGGVKNVSCSLSEALVKAGNQVVVFMPLYGCTDLDELDQFSCMHKRPVQISINSKKLLVTYSSGILNGVKFVFIGNKAFSEKNAVYTYTRKDEKLNPSHKNGHGHEDGFFLDSIFQKAICAYANCSPQEDAPDIVHCQDATSAILPCLIQNKIDLLDEKQNFYQNTKCIITIHNAGPGYHHELYSMDQAKKLFGFSDKVLSSALNKYSGNAIEPFLLGAQNAVLTTVSPQYAKEIEEGKTDTQGLSESFQDRGIRIAGITNGMDYEKYDPSDRECSHLPFEYNPCAGDFEGKKKLRNYFYQKYASKESSLSAEESHEITKFGWLSANEKMPVFVYQGRVVSQKGIRQLALSCEKLLSSGVQAHFVFMGQGQSELENLLIELSQKYAGKALYFRGYDRVLSRLCIAQSDFSIIPSEFEPCCLEDFISQIFGTLPVAHRTGGLGKILSEYNGYLYEPNTPEEIASIVDSLTSIYMNMGSDCFDTMKTFAATYVRDNCSWKSVCENEYIPFYQKLLSSGS